jgi:hypothetical protein
VPVNERLAFARLAQDLESACDDDVTMKRGIPGLEQDLAARDTASLTIAGKPSDVFWHERWEDVVASFRAYFGSHRD